jgi:phosphate transport system substrate-binding protein
MGGRDYPSSSLKMAGNEQIAQEVAKNKNGIGYVGLAYSKTAGTKTIVIDGVEPVAKNAKKYAYARPCFIYAPDKPTPEAGAFLAYIASPAGQDIVRKVGFIPVKDL